jgi:hypothetical protein
MSSDTITVHLSGPGEHRAPLLSALDRAGVDVSVQRSVNPGHGLPHEEGLEWVQGITDDLRTVEKVLERFKKWRLRQHYATPEPPKQAPNPLLPRLGELEARIAALEATR